MTNFIPDYTPYKTLSCLFYDTMKGYASDEEVKAYEQLLPAGATHILEAMCGSGRLMIPLMHKGYIVHGIDTSPTMLERCQERARQQALTITVYQQPLEQLDIPARYDAITIAVGSFQLLTDPDQALSALIRMRQHLKPGGVILIDTFMPDLTITRLEPRKAPQSPHEHIVLYTRYVPGDRAQTVHALNEYQHIRSGTVIGTEFEILPIAWRTHDQWRQLCAQAGLTVVDFYPTAFRPALSSAIMKLTPARP